MIENIYDATIKHEPAQSDVRIDGETRCPDCDERLFPDPTEPVLDDALESRIVAPAVCPECDADLEFIIEPMSTDEIGLGICLVHE